jgi:hypothetical protein
MNLPESIREINPLLDGMARGNRPDPGNPLGLAAGLGLATPDGDLTADGQAYAQPGVTGGPSALVMTSARRAAASRVMAGPLPLPAALRRLLRQIVHRKQRLVSPLDLGWPEVLLRPYLAYLEDLGLLVAVGPLVEVTPAGEALAALPDPLPSWPRWTPPGPAAAPSMNPILTPTLTPTFRSALFRYHLVRRVCMALLTMRGRREWHRLQPLLDGPLGALQPACAEWLSRFQQAQPGSCRIWAPERVAQFEARIAYPAWFGDWTRALLNASPDGAVEALARSPLLLEDPPVLDAGLPSREGWLVAAALAWTTRRGRLLLYAEATGRLRQDGLILPPWPDMLATLEAAGLLVTTRDPARLVLATEVRPPAEAIWPYGSPDLLAAALLEGGAVGIPEHVRRPAPI